MCKERKSMGGLRGATRLFAVQVLYGADVLNKTVSDVLSHEYLTRKVVLSEDISLDDIDSAFLKQLVTAYGAHSEEIDELILSHLSDKWTIERLNKVLVAILRLGLTELMYMPDIPANVTFNEYVEISKAYFNKSEVSFVNGLLNAVYKESEKEKILGGGE